MRITVAICTWNRCQLLRQTLEQLTRLVVPEGVTWELLVVNNNSTDATDQVISAYAGRLPLRRVFEPRPGVSHARNTAVREADGDYMVCTDDDVVVDPHWLAAYVEAFQRWPDAGIFGGPIDPWFEGTPPQWLEAAFACIAGAYAMLDLGPEVVPLDHDTYPFGANMAFRSDVLASASYDPALGPRPGSAVRGEEMLLIRSLLAAGEQGWWVPAARVQHFIPRDRQTLQYLRQYYLGGGQLLAYLEEGQPNGAPRFLGRPLWLWRQAVTYEARFQVLRFLARPEVWMEDLKLASLSWGQLRGHRSA
jgi:glucosyl-dolichyl phosphate glucuronosyltransferase